MYNNPELESMAKEIQELLQEKMLLEREVISVFYDVFLIRSEINRV